MIEINIVVEGMKCGMCESHVNGVKKVKSSHKNKESIVIAEDHIDHNEIIKAITSQGYTIGRIEVKPYVKHSLFGRKK